MALPLLGVSEAGTYPGTPQDPVLLELTRCSSRDTAGKQWHISVVIDLYGFSFAGFFLLYY